MIAFALYGIAAVLSLVAALVVMPSRQLVRRDRGAVAVALLANALWCVATAALGAHSLLAGTLEVARNLAWVYALFRHFANDGRDETLRGVRQVATALATVETLHLLLLFAEANRPAVELSALLRMLVAVGALVLVHNLFGGASQPSRRLLGWNSAGLTLYWLFELNYHTIAYLTGAFPPGFEVPQALVMAMVAAAFAIGALQGRAGLTFRPSRAVTLSTLSLAMVAVYFLVMVGLANGVARFAGDLARVTQVGFLLLAATAALVWLPSPRLRGTARVLALKHLFKHRYDYREEWLRFTRTIGSASAGTATLQERAIQSLADITDSTAGLLLTPQDEGDLELAAHWRWPTMAVPARAIPQALARKFEAHKLILDLDEVRAGVDRFGEQALVPQWLRDEPAAWAGVPLLHGERLVGLVVLARPQVSRRPDWEDFDLLGIAGQQVASYLSEQAGQEALQDAERFEEFSRRMAFVMHDIKNLSSQLALLARNAERHAENPEFRKDMLVTLRNSADKLDALVARLGRYGGKSGVVLAPIDPCALARRLAQRFAPLHPVACLGDGAGEVLGNEELLEQALVHLLQNAVEASEPGSPIAIEVGSEGLRGTIAVVDSGRGMSAQFVRNGLFRPFVSTKENGFGIGVCEARDHARAMGGRLDVESREGLGSRFTISLPLAAPSRLLAGRAGTSLTDIEKAA
jgi:putative PEP-CTERM system histidine kinase